MAGKTEWEDALIKHGIMEAPPVVRDPDEVHEEELERKREADGDPLAKKSLEQLDELEDDVDERVLDQYRLKRIAELKEGAAKKRFGAFKQISQTEFVAEVSKAPPDVFVVCHLFEFSKPECQLLNDILGRLAVKFADLKFVRIIGSECIQKYPSSNCPTIIVYKAGDIALNVVGLQLFGGLKATDKTVEWFLAQKGILNTTMKRSPMEEATQFKMKTNFISKVSKKTKKNKADDDSGSDRDNEDDK